MRGILTASDLPTLASAIEQACSEEVLADLSIEDRRRLRSEIRFEEKCSTPWDDDLYFAATSPFDGKFYIFAVGVGGGLPTQPSSVSEGRPEWFDDD